jgi:L-amino acid N-acyltransferase YncA
MTHKDLPQVQQIINLSFGRFFRIFASQSLHEEGQVLVSETESRIVSFAKLTKFSLKEANCACILWIVTHPQFRGKGIASGILNEALQLLKLQGVVAVFASVGRRNSPSLKLFGMHGFRKMGFLDLWEIFRLNIFRLYSDIWYAPREIVLMLNLTGENYGRESRI